MTMKANMKWTRLLAIVLVLMLGMTALAESSWIDLDAKGSITLTLKSKDTGNAVAGGKITLYQVATVAVDDGDLSFAYTNGFENCGIELGDLSSSTLAGQLKDKVTSSMKSSTQTVGKDGKVSFTGLDLGLYLLVQTTAADGYNAVSPFIVSVPLTEDGSYTYDVDASPKVETVTVKPTPTPSTPPDDDLPQTGQLDWPIPVLCVVGLLLFAAGWMLRKEKHHHEA